MFFEARFVSENETPAITNYCLQDNVDSSESWRFCDDNKKFASDDDC